MRRGRVLVVGDVITDILAVHSGHISVGSDTPAEITLAAGGSAANTAAWLAAVDVDVDLVAVVGGDAAGEQRLVELAAAGVGVSTVRRTPDAATGSIIVLVDGRERSFLSDRGANLLLASSDVDAAVAAGPVRHVHVSGYPLLDPRSRAAGRHALAVAANIGATSSVDAASAAPLRKAPEFLDWVRGADLLLANLDEARALLAARSGPTPRASIAPADGDTLALELTRAVDRVVVKLAADGAVWAESGAVLAREPARPTAVVDPTGAGDAFAAGLLSAWLGGAEPIDALREGARLGALAVARLGARP